MQKLPSTDSGHRPETLLIGSLYRTGFKQKEIELASLLDSSPTLYDFSIIFIRYSNDSFATSSTEKWDEVKKFFKSGGMLCIIGIDSTLERHAMKLLGRSLPHLRSHDGKQIIWTRGTYLYGAVKEISQGKWHTVVERSDEKGITIIARNKVNEGIAFEISVENGKLILLPDFDTKELGRIQRNLLKIFKQQISSLSSISKPPQWFETILMPIQKTAQDALDQATNRIKSIEKYKRVLFEEGKDLSKHCSLLLKEILGAQKYDVLYLEEQGIHDIEIANDSKLIVIEVRASNGLINVDLVRQLFDNVQKATKRGKTIKGLAIGNPFRLDDPHTRRQSFSRESIDLAERNSFCLITTIQLLEWYNRIILGISTKDAFIDHIYSTVGEMKQDAIAWLS